MHRYLLEGLTVSPPIIKSETWKYSSLHQIFLLLLMLYNTQRHINTYLHTQMPKFKTNRYIGTGQKISLRKGIVETCKESTLMRAGNFKTLNKNAKHFYMYDTEYD